MCTQGNQRLNNLDDQFWENKNTWFQSALLPQNNAKNRYGDVLPNEKSRIVLQNPPNGYINANWIDGKSFNISTNYISTQGPLPSTIGDFWMMVYEQNAGIILMVTRTEESGRTKCATYWPQSKEQPICIAVTPSGNQVIKGSLDNQNVMTIGLEEEVDLKSIVVGITQRVFQLSYQGTKRTVTQFQYSAWPDHGIPSETYTFRKLRNMVNELHAVQYPGTPIVIHCSAGIGRTGTYLTVDIILKQFENAENKNLFSVDVFETVRTLRHLRSGLIQMVNQYKFVYLCLADELLSPTPHKLKQ